MRHLAQARNPYSRRRLWIPGSLAQRKIDARINFGARFAPRNDELIEICVRRSGETMTIADKLVLQRQHHLKWRAFDRLELILMMLCGLLCFGFSLSVMSDIVTRTIGHPWLWLQEVTSTLFIYAIFIGAAVATRRNDHLYLTAISEALHGTPRLIVEIIIRLVVLGVAFCLVWFGYINFLRGFGSFRLPSGTPIASLYAAIPLAGLLIGLFAVEQLVNGIRNGFDHPEPPEVDADIRPADAIPPTRVGL
jgi:TRAP-type C4-dicarboxylate transport system permease small subunit